MAKLARTYQPEFGSQGNNDEFAVFGTMKTGTPVYSKTVAELFQSPAFLQGWQDAVAADKAPFLEEMNGLFLSIFQQLAYQFQTGIPEWDNTTAYYANTSFCQLNGVIYQSTSDENIGNNPAEDIAETNWKKVTVSTIWGQITGSIAEQTDLQEVLMTKTNVAQAAQAAMPSISFINLAIAQSGALYTAPASGYFFGYSEYSDAWVTIYNTTCGIGSTSGSTRTIGPRVYVPVNKGDKVGFSYIDTTNTTRLHFIYANGTAPTEEE